MGEHLTADQTWAAPAPQHTLKTLPLTAMVHIHQAIKCLKIIMNVVKSLPVKVRCPEASTDGSDAQEKHRLHRGPAEGSSWSQKEPVSACFRRGHTLFCPS